MVAPRLGVAQRHAAAADVDGERLGSSGEPLLRDDAAPRLALLVVVAACTGRTDALDRPQLPAGSTKDERRAPIADGEVAVLDLPAHCATVCPAAVRRERVFGLTPFATATPFGLDDHRS